MEWITQPWPWYVGGPLIAIFMLLLLYLGGVFGLSSNFRTFCVFCGGEKCSDFFCYDWKSQRWNLALLIGTIIGGFISHQFLTPVQAVDISPEIVTQLEGYGIKAPGSTYMPEEYFSWNALKTWRGWIMLVLGGLFVGFGSRWAGGCTSGHAISGLSNLQFPSLIAVIGFFIGGLLVTYLLLPHLLPIK